MNATASDADLREWLALLEQYFAPLLKAAGYCTPDAPTPIIPLEPDDLLDANNRWPSVVIDELPSDWFATVVDPLRLKSKALRNAGTSPLTLDAFARSLKRHDDGRDVPRACRRSAVAAALRARDSIRDRLEIIARPPVERDAEMVNIRKAERRATLLAAIRKRWPGKRPKSVRDVYQLAVDHQLGVSEDTVSRDLREMLRLGEARPDELPSSLPLD